MTILWLFLYNLFDPWWLGWPVLCFTTTHMSRFMIISHHMLLKRTRDSRRYLDSFGPIQSLRTSPKHDLKIVWKFLIYLHKVSFSKYGASLCDIPCEKHMQDMAIARRAGVGLCLGVRIWQHPRPSRHFWIASIDSVIPSSSGTKPYCAVNTSTQRGCSRDKQKTKLYGSKGLLGLFCPAKICENFEHAKAAAEPPDFGEY
jgi:hypothetical protein